MKPSLGERIARRLIEQHGIKLELEPMNYRVARDQEAIAYNYWGGLDYPTWRLLDPALSANVRVTLGDGSEVLVDTSIGSDQPASYIVRCPRWSLERDWGAIKIHGEGGPPRKFTR